jgi:hypothetical protein
MNAFQETGVVALNNALISRLFLSEPLVFDEVVGRKENYLKTQLFSKEKVPIEIFIYIDEAGFMYGKKWFIFEKYDFDSQDELMKKFITQLCSFIER